MGVIDLNLVCLADNPFARVHFKRKDNLHESRQINLLTDYGLFAQTQISSIFIRPDSYMSTTILVFS